MKTRSRFLMFQLLLMSVSVTRSAETNIAPYITFPVTGGLYFTGLAMKRPLKTALESAVTAVINHNGNEIVTKALSRSLDRGSFTSLGFLIYALVQFVGRPAPEALIIKNAFNAGAVAPIASELFNKIQLWYNTLDSNEHITQEKQNQTLQFSPFEYSQKSTRTTMPWCGDSNPHCSFQTHQRYQEAPGISPLTFLKDSGIMALGFIVGYHIHKAGSSALRWGISYLKPSYTEQGIEDANIVSRLLFIAQKMAQGFIDYYGPATVYRSFIEPLISRSTDPTIQDHEDITFLTGLFAEIFWFACFGEHKKLLGTSEKPAGTSSH